MPYRARLFGGERRDLLPGLFVAVMAFLIYANSLGNGFVSDDHSVILHNPVLRDTPQSVFSRIDTTNENQLLPYYRPLTYLTYHLEWRLHGFDPFLVRLINVLLHSANAFLVYRLALSFITSRSAALLAGLLFAMHPLHSEAVDYNSARNTLLSCVFILLAYLSHRNSVRKGNFPLAFAGAFFYLAALFSKESSLAILPLIAALESAPLREPRPGARVRSAVRILPYIAGTLCYLTMRWITLSKFGLQEGLLPGLDATERIQSMYATTELGTRLLQNLYIVPRYLLTVIYPVALSSRYVVPDDLSALIVPLSFAWICILGGLGWLLTRGRSSATLFGLAWILLFWLPVSGVIYFPSAPLADRFFYAPAIGLWLIVADQTSRFLPKGATARRYGMVIAAAVLIALAIVTVRRNFDWKNDLSLSERLVAQYPDNPHGHLFLASAYIGRRSENDLERAEQEYYKALSLDPGMLMAHTPLGYICMLKADYECALHHYAKALEASPSDRDARINRALALEKTGRTREALEAYRYYLSMPGYNNVPGSREYAEERLRALAR